MAAESTAVAAAAPNFWVPREVIDQPSERRELSTLAEAVVCSIYDRVMKPVLGERDWAGAEWWSQVYNEPGKGLAFHFDKDEHLMEADGRMENPIWSSIVYLNSAAECSGAPGAAAAGGAPAARLSATLIMNQTFDPSTREAVPEPFRECAVVWPTENSFCAFDGRLAHGVLDSSSPLVRRTLLINWWDHRPLKVSRRTAEEYTGEFALSPAADPAAYSAEEGSRPAGEAALPSLTVSAATHCPEGPLSLQDALSDGGSKPAPDYAILKHLDCVLWQVEDEEGRPLMAFIPDALLPGCDEESDSESSSSSSGIAAGDPEVKEVGEQGGDAS